jgi:hypothetical protein
MTSVKSQTALLARARRTPQEVTEALGMAIYMGAGLSVIYASHALEALAQFVPPDAKSSATAT